MHSKELDNIKYTYQQIILVSFLWFYFLIWSSCWRWRVEDKEEERDGESRVDFLRRGKIVACLKRKGRKPEERKKLNVVMEKATGRVPVALYTIHDYMDKMTSNWYPFQGCAAVPMWWEGQDCNETIYWPMQMRHNNTIRSEIYVSCVKPLVTTQTLYAFLSGTTSSNVVKSHDDSSTEMGTWWHKTLISYQTISQHDSKIRVWRWRCNT